MNIDKTLNLVLKNLNLFESITEDEITSLISGILKANLIKVSLKTLENIPAGTLITGNEPGKESEGYVSVETLFDYIFTGFVIPINTRIHRDSDKTNNVNVLRLPDYKISLEYQGDTNDPNNMLPIRDGLARIDFDLGLLYLSKQTNLEEFLTQALKTPYLFFKNEFSNMCDNEYKALNKKEENKALKIFKTAMHYGQLKFVGLKYSPGLDARGLIQYTTENVFEIRINLQGLMEESFRRTVIDTILHEITHLGQYVTKAIYDKNLRPIDGILTPRMYLGGPQPLTVNAKTGLLGLDYASQRHEIESRIKGSLRQENLPILFNNIAKDPEAEKFLHKMYDKISMGQIKIDTVIALLIKHYFETVWASFDELFSDVMRAINIGKDIELQPFIEDSLMAHLLDNKRVFISWLENTYGTPEREAWINAKVKELRDKGIYYDRQSKTK